MRLCRSLDRGEIVQLASRLQDVPQAYRMLGLLRSHLEDHCRHATYVDRWPDFTSVITMVEDGKRFQVFARDITVFSFDWGQGENFFSNFLDSFRWTSQWRFTVLSASHGDRLQRLVEARGLGGCEPGDQLVCVYATPQDLRSSQQQQPRSSLPEGYIEDRVRSSDIVAMTTAWGYTATLGMRTATDLFSALIEHFPSVCLRHSPIGGATRVRGQGEVSDDVTVPPPPVGWCMQYPHGGLAALHVLPEHRRKGLAAYLVRRMSAKVLSEGEAAVWAFRDHRNEVSAKLFAECGFRRASEETIDRFYLNPPGDTRPSRQGGITDGVTNDVTE